MGPQIQILRFLTFQGCQSRKAIRFNYSFQKQHEDRKKKATGADERRTDDDRVVVGDEHLAVDVDELCDQASLQLGVSAQTGEGDVVHPLIVHCG